MPITWIPVRGFGYYYKYHLVGRGQYINENDCIMMGGTFNQSGLLDFTDCEVIDYSDSVNVNIRIGQYANGNEDGTIYEYVFPKASWTNFFNNVSVNSTRYTHTFSEGNWVSTSETMNNVPITSGFNKNGNQWIGFDVSE